jgi:hypothetical protein
VFHFVGPPSAQKLNLSRFVFVNKYTSNLFARGNRDCAASAHVLQLRRAHVNSFTLIIAMTPQDLRTANITQPYHDPNGTSRRVRVLCRTPTGCDFFNLARVVEQRPINGTSFFGTVGCCMLPRRRRHATPRGAPIPSCTARCGAISAARVRLFDLCRWKELTCVCVHSPSDGS